MSDRPALNQSLDSKTFKSYYYLKEELVDLCRRNGLPVSGGKMEIAERISCFLDTGKVQAARTTRKAAANTKVMTEDSIIEPDFVCTERHRAFFKERIGKGFSFHVAFQKWLKSNAGKSYGDAIDAYHRIVKEKKQGKTVIDRQFEYNTYIRDFFVDNKGKSLEEAITCWNYKKGLKGHNRYEKSDLSALS